jgi:hypothetical protein
MPYGYVARVDVPPLRAREGDIDLLARHFWSRYGGRPEDLLPSTLTHFSDRQWPGNVRGARERHRATRCARRSGRRTSWPTSGAIRKDRRLLSRLPSAVCTRGTVRSKRAFPGRYHWSGDCGGALVPCGTRTPPGRVSETLLGRYGGNISKAAAASGVAPVRVNAFETVVT